MVRSFSLFILILCIACAHVPKKERGQDPYYDLVRSNLKAYEGDLDAALKDLEKAITSFPENAFLKYLAAERYAQAQNWEKASFYIDGALQLKSDWGEARLLKGDILEALGEFKKAGEVFQIAIQTKPKKEEGYFRLAQNLIHREKYHGAIQILQKWLTREPESSIALYYIATIQNVYLKNPQQALRAYQKIISLDPGNIRVRGQVAQIYVKSGNKKEALEEFRAIERQYPNDLSVKLEIAALYQDLGDLERAIGKLQEILTINPKADRIHYFLGLLFGKTKEWSKALHHFGEVLPSSGLYKDAVLQEVLIYRDQRQNERGIVILKKAISKKSDIPPFYQFLSQLWEETGKMDLAVDVLKRGLKKNPNDEGLYFALGVLYDKLKQREESIAVMKRVLEMNPKNAQALNYIGYTYAEMGENLEEAERIILEALALKPGDGYIIDSLGWVYYQRGDLKKALQQLQKAYQILPEEPVIVEHLADLYLKMGQKSHARRLFERALELGKKKEKPNREEMERVGEKIEELKAENREPKTEN